MAEASSAIAPCVQRHPPKRIQYPNILPSAGPVMGPIAYTETGRPRSCGAKICRQPLLALCSLKSPLTSAQVATPSVGPTDPKTPQKKRRTRRAAMLLSAPTRGGRTWARRRRPCRRVRRGVGSCGRLRGGRRARRWVRRGTARRWGQPTRAITVGKSRIIKRPKRESQPGEPS